MAKTKNLIYILISIGWLLIIGSYFIESPIMKWNFGDQSLKWPGYIDLRDDIKTNANKAINEP